MLRSLLLEVTAQVLLHCAELLQYITVTKFDIVIVVIIRLHDSRCRLVTDDRGVSL